MAEGRGGEVQVFDIASCPVESVVVFLDRAEVCRTIDTKVKAGENEVVLRNVSSAADGDSIRVEGQGVATISEVSFQKKHVTVDEVVEKNLPATEGSQQEEAKLKAELKQAEERLGVLKGELNRLMTQQSVLDSFGDQLIQQAGQEGVISLGESETLQGLSRYLELYEKRTEEVDDRKLDLEAEIRIVESKISTLQTNLRERFDKGQKKSTSLTKMERQISILLDAEKEGDVHLIVYYVVLHASWSPKYDVRTFVKDGRMQVHYFGVIKQSTDEDWKDARISLSTAVPSVGGTPPTITASTLSFPRYGRFNYNAKNSKSRGMGSFRKKKRPRAVAQFAGGGAPGEAQFGQYGMDSCSESEGEMTRPSAEVQSGAFTTTFDIEKTATIPADNTGHKVQVAILEFKPSFSYESVPKVSARAFLKANVKNDSPYALLAGPSNIFLEGNFVAKSSLPAISPLEQFECSLGVDPSVRITYKPVQRFREQSGLMSKTTKFKYSQVIQIKNTQQEPVTIKVIDQLPLSTEEKIKVLLIAPELRKPERGKQLPPDAYPRMNQSNNIEWQVRIAGGKGEELQLRYTVEFPSESRIDGL
ncbi:protein F37C4.5-like [Sycon ciliatum]|uniref:protein F37C4.5-like n=1 Tax=Sycon ciliatum TaxID=27933 RepID=UPI0031F66602